MTRTFSFDLRRVHVSDTCYIGLVRTLEITILVFIAIRFDWRCFLNKSFKAINLSWCCMGIDPIHWPKIILLGKCNVSVKYHIILRPHTTESRKTINLHQEIYGAFFKPDKEHNFWSNEWPNRTLVREKSLAYVRTRALISSFNFWCAIH